MSGIDAYTKLYIPFDGTDGSTDIIDASLYGRTITVNGGAQIDTAYSVFGGSSGLFDGDTDFLSIGYSSDFALGTNDFTFDFRFRLTSNTGTNVIYSHCVAGTEIIIAVDSGTFTYSPCKLRFEVTSGGTTYTLETGEILSDDQWYAALVSRYGDDLFLYIDGDLKDTLTMSSSFSIDDPGTTIYIGIDDPSSSYYYFKGHIDEFRFSNGIARQHNTNYSLPTSAYSVDNIVNCFPVIINSSLAGQQVVSTEIMSLPLALVSALSGSPAVDEYIAANPIIIVTSISSNVGSFQVVEALPFSITATSFCASIKSRTTAPSVIVAAGGLMSLQTYVYNRFNEILADGTNDFSSHIYKAALMSTTYDPDIDSHEFWSDISGHEVAENAAYAAGGRVLDGLVLTRNDSTDITSIFWGPCKWDVPYGYSIDDIKGFVVYNASLGTKSLLAFFEFQEAVTVAQETSFLVTPVIQIQNGGA